MKASYTFRGQTFKVGVAGEEWNAYIDGYVALEHLEDATGEAIWRDLRDAGLDGFHVPLEIALDIAIRHRDEGQEADTLIREIGLALSCRGKLIRTL